MLSVRKDDFWVLFPARQTHCDSVWQVGHKKNILFVQILFTVKSVNCTINLLSHWIYYTCSDIAEPTRDADLVQKICHFDQFWHLLIVFLCFYVLKMLRVNNIYPYKLLNTKDASFCGEINIIHKKIVQVQVHPYSISDKTLI